MSQGPRRPPEGDDTRFTVSLAALAFVILLAIVGYFVLDHLAAESKLEDCMMAGRHDCMPIAKPD
ncbi:MAG: hypothetical protein ACREFQ_11065 [Stellaceae bacterium]